MNQWKIVCLSLLTIFYGAYFVKQLRLRRKGISTNRLARGCKAKRSLALELALLLVTYVMAFGQYISVYQGAPSVSSGFKITGFFCLIGGIVIFISALSAMADNWRAGIDSSQQTQMVTGGIYKFSRNPAFTGFDLFYLGVMFLYPNRYLVCLTAAAILLFHLQILAEERYLAITFQEAYINYQKKTARYLFF